MPPFGRVILFFPFRKPLFTERDGGLISVIHYILQDVKVQSRASHQCHTTLANKKARTENPWLFQSLQCISEVGFHQIVIKTWIYSVHFSSLPCIWSSGSERFLSAGMYLSTTVSSPLYCIRESVMHSACREPTIKEHYRAIHCAQVLVLLSL